MIDESTPVMQDIELMKTHLRLIDPYALLDLLDPATASHIVEAWMAGRGTRSLKTEAGYAKKALELRHKYAARCDCDPSDLTPESIVVCFFDQSAKMTFDAWMSYRSVLLHHLASTRTDQLSRGWKIARYTKALAALIIVDQPPEIDLRTKGERLPGRCESISTKRIDALFTWLRHHPSKFSAAAEVFATATLITGLRPCEWPDVEVVDSASDVGVDESGLRIVVRTGKRKADEPLVVRTLLITTIEAQTIVQRQLAQARALAAVAHTERVRTPYENYIRKISAHLGFASSILWPDQERVTLYTFRHQARADLVAAFGESIAAAMLGHGTEVGRKFYAPGRKARGRHLAVRPGDDVIARAALLEQETSAQRVARKPWSRPDVESLERDDQPGEAFEPPESGS